MQCKVHVPNYMVYVGLVYDTAHHNVLYGGGL